ncbi:MAG: hypothetical protein KDK90_27600, partial [Leptospiraceae bacterium]|nr:hypothetical protein [Leptospiraceae bacterium]
MKYKFTFSLLLLFNCSSFQLSKHDGFIDWLNGKPGMKNTEFISKNPRSGVVIGERHPYYLWFRTPEIIFNPQGGLYYPDMFIMVDYELYDTTDLSSVKDEKYKLKILNRRNGQFTRVDEGLIDYLFQYRELIDPSGQ